MGETFPPIHTARFQLRPPQESDAAAIFDRYASDPEVVRYVGWPRHESLTDTLSFLDFSNVHWEKWSCGPLLIEDRFTGLLLGATGLTCDTPARASTGWVLARDAWGKGTAPEVMAAITQLAQGRGTTDLYALCHVEHTRSRRALERSGFTLAEVKARAVVFPNLGTQEAQDVCNYTWRAMETVDRL